MFSQYSGISLAGQIDHWPPSSANISIM